MFLDGESGFAAHKARLIFIGESGDTAFSSALSEVWLDDDSYLSDNYLQMKDLVPSLYEYYWDRDNTASSISLCSEAPRPRLVPLERGQVTIGNGLSVHVRYAPGLSSIVAGTMLEGTQFKVLGGPLCRDGYWWWFIEPGEGYVPEGGYAPPEEGLVDPEGNRGWAMEGDDPGYFLEPILS